MEPEEELSFDENEFLVNDYLWMVVPRSIGETDDELRRGAARVVTRRGKTIMVFTDSDLAYRFIDANGGRARLKAVTIPDLSEFVACLERLVELGETDLAFDAGDKHARIISIPRVLDGIRNRRR